MADNYYDDDGEAVAAEPESEKQDSEPASALVPKTFFSGKEDLAVGDTEVVKVLRIMDDEVEIECVKEGYGEEKAPEEAPVSEEDEMMA